jgi:protein-tyrosine phosphatase
MDGIAGNLAEFGSPVAGPSGDGSYVDVHCHCLPFIDDGPQTMTEAVALCRALVADGVGTVVATAHQLGRFGDANDAVKIRDNVRLLHSELCRRGIGLTVLAGADVRVDERICQLLQADRILTVADGGRYILLELPDEVFIDILPLLQELSAAGVQAIISHPERHRVLAQQPAVLHQWVCCSACLQITAGSLLSDFGCTVQKAAWGLLESNLVCVVATDAHDLNKRRPRMRAAFERISRKLGPGVARALCIENPARILEGCHISAAAFTELRNF